MCPTGCCPYSPAGRLGRVCNMGPVYMRDSVNIHLHNCSVALIPNDLPCRNCDLQWSPIPVYELKNVSLCIRDESGNHDLGIKDCYDPVPSNFTTLGSLPEQVDLVCGGTAYSCVPSNSKGTCY